MACGNGGRRARVIPHVTDKVALVDRVQLNPVTGHVGGPSLHHETGRQELAVGCQVKVLLSAGQVEAVMNVVIVIRRAPTALLSVIVTMSQLVAHQLSAARHLARHHHLVAGQRLDQLS